MANVAAALAVMSAILATAAFVLIMIVWSKPEVIAPGSMSKAESNAEAEATKEPGYEPAQEPGVETENNSGYMEGGKGQERIHVFPLVHWRKPYMYINDDGDVEGSFLEIGKAVCRAAQKQCRFPSTGSQTTPCWDSVEMSSIGSGLEWSAHPGTPQGDAFADAHPPQPTGSIITYIDYGRAGFIPSSSRMRPPIGFVQSSKTGQRARDYHSCILGPPSGYIKLLLRGKTTLGDDEWVAVFVRYFDVDSPHLQSTHDEGDWIVELPEHQYGFKEKDLFIPAEGRTEPPSDSAQIEQQPEEEVSAEPDVPEECTVCLTDLYMDDDCRQLQCLHVFHQTCIDQWFAEARTCPICRREDDQLQTFMVQP